MNTNMTRRSVALAGPTALALGTLGPVATLATLGGISTQANAQTASGGTVNIDGFINFYNTKFVSYATSVARRAVAYQATLHYLSGNANVPPGSTQWFSVYESFADKFGADVALCESYYSGYPATVQDQVHDRARIWFHDDTPDSRLNLPARTFTSLTLVSFNDFFYTLTENNIYSIRANSQRDWHKLAYFVKATAPDSYFALLAQKSTAAEATDDQRLLKGTVPDSLEEVKNWLGHPTGELRVKFGNLRKPAERVELTNTRNWFTSLFRGSYYTPTNVINHGLNSTTIEPPVRTITLSYTSQAYKLDSEQIQGIEYYVNADIAKNGAFEHMTVDQSKRALRQHTTFVSRETGLVYPSYVAAQLILRGAAQATIASVRGNLYTKTIDLLALQKNMIAVAFMEEPIRALYDASKTTLRNGLIAITAEVIAGMLLSSIAIAESRKVVAENKGKGTTAAVDVAQARARTMIRITSSVTAAQLTALGVLGVTAFSASEITENSKFLWRIGTGGAFAVSDLTSGISDYVTVFRSGTQTTPVGVATLMGATCRIAGGLWGLSEAICKLFNCSWVDSHYKNYPALVVNTNTASAAACLYTMAGIMAAAIAAGA